MAGCKDVWRNLYPPHVPVIMIICAVVGPLLSNHVRSREGEISETF